MACSSRACTSNSAKGRTIEWWTYPVAAKDHLIFICACSLPSLLAHSYCRTQRQAKFDRVNSGTKSKYSSTHLDRPGSFSQTFSRRHEIFTNATIVLLARSILVPCIALCMYPHALDGQRGELWEAVCDAGHKRTSREWDTHARSTDWSRIS